MPSIRKNETKSGKVFYEIRCHIDRDRPVLSTRWYPPEGWSKRAIDRELHKVAAEFERQCKDGKVLSRSEQNAKKEKEAAEAAKILTLRQYGEQVFLPAKAITCSGNTISSFQGHLDKYIYPIVGDVKLPDITSVQLSKLLLDVQASGKAHATVVKIYTVMQSLFKMAYRNDMIDRNPLDKVERPKPRKDEMKKDSIACYTAEEICYILDCLDKESLKWKVYVRLLVDTGIRRGECCGLKWKNIDLWNNTITISGNLCYTPEKGVYLDTPKNGRERTIDVDPTVISLLKQLYEEQTVLCPSEWVFTQEDNPKPMHPQSPTKYLKKLSERYGIVDLHPHKLRHSFASIAITNGADIASISEKLGHRDKAVTLRMYTHANQESMKRASDIFRAALAKKSVERIHTSVSAETNNGTVSRKPERKKMG